MVPGSSSKKVGSKPPLRRNSYCSARVRSHDRLTDRAKFTPSCLQERLAFFCTTRTSVRLAINPSHFSLTIIAIRAEAHFPPPPQRNIPSFPRLRSSSSHDYVTERGWVDGLRKTDSNVMRRDDRVSIIKIVPRELQACSRSILSESRSLNHVQTFVWTAFTSSKLLLFIVNWIFVKIFVHCASLDLPKIGFLKEFKA